MKGNNNFFAAPMQTVKTKNEYYAATQSHQNPTGVTSGPTLTGVTVSQVTSPKSNLPQMPVTNTTDNNPDISIKVDSILDQDS